MDDLWLLYKAVKKTVKKTIIKDLIEAINHKPTITAEIVGEKEAEKIKKAKEIKDKSK